MVLLRFHRPSKSFLMFYTRPTTWHRPHSIVTHRLRVAQPVLRHSIRADAAQPDHAWQLLRQATQLDARGKLMGSAMVRQQVYITPASTFLAGVHPRRATPTAHRCGGALCVCAARIVSHHIHGICTTTHPLPCQEAASVANPAVGWDPRNPSLLISVLASDARLALRALRDYCDGLRIAQPARIESRVR